MTRNTPLLPRFRETLGEPNNMSRTVARKTICKSPRAIHDRGLGRNLRHNPPRPAAPEAVQNRD
eukprot:636491-Pyramimonas_sp.AAC.1